MRISPGARRLLLPAIGLVALAAIGMNALAYLATEQERLAIVRGEEQVAELWSTTTRLGAAIAGQQVAVADYVLGGAAPAITRYRASIRAEDAAIEDLRQDAVGLPAYTAYLDMLRGSSTDWRSGYAQQAIAAVMRDDDAALAELDGRSLAERAPVERALGAMTQSLRERQAELKGLEDQLAMGRNLSTVVQLLFGVLVTIGGLWLFRRYGQTIQREADHAGVLNRFTEYARFASDESAVAASNLEALHLLVTPDAAVTHLLNRSRDRALPEATLGDPIAEVLPLNALSHCPGVIRGSAYVTSDASRPLSVRCPIYPVDHGTLACLPLNSGEPVGALHLYWGTPNAFPLEERAQVMRLVDNAALALGNRRLLAALQGQASTDARTGLANSRAFDQALEEALLKAGVDHPVGVLMLDLDHFKDFNDRYGHPAGDEALRTFAGVLRSCLRDQDLAARYGGEEFAVLLPGLDGEMAVSVAERIRSRTESTLIALGPGITDRVTVSIGVAMAPAQSLQPVVLMRLADEALYRAKAQGRNRVCPGATCVDESPRALPSLSATA